jgi:hypothetical protein
MVNGNGVDGRGELRRAARGQLPLKCGDLILERVELTHKVVNFEAQLLLRFPAAIPEDVNNDK